MKVLGFVNKSGFRSTKKPLLNRAAQSEATGLLAALGFGVRLFAFEIVCAPSAFLYFVGLLTHGELLPLY